MPSLFAYANACINQGLALAFSAPRSRSPTASTVPNSLRLLMRIGLTVTPTSAPLPTNRTSAPAKIAHQLSQLCAAVLPV